MFYVKPMGNIIIYMMKEEKKWKIQCLEKNERRKLYFEYLKESRVENHEVKE
jgi:hypothetical protein